MRDRSYRRFHYHLLRGLLTQNGGRIAHLPESLSL
jgi:hypothetical protein